MVKQKRATLILKSGVIMTVPVVEPGWPPTIDYRVKDQDETRTVRFTYTGVQHGVGAYVEAEV